MLRKVPSELTAYEATYLPIKDFPEFKDIQRL